MERLLKGFTLLEVLVALVILSIGLLSLAKFQTSVMRSNVIAKERTKAVILAREVIENYRIFSVDSINDNTFEINNTALNRTTNFSRTYETQTLINGDMRISVTVTWPDLNNDKGKATDETTIRLGSVISTQELNRNMAKLKLTPSVGLTCLGGYSAGIEGGC